MNKKIVIFLVTAMTLNFIPVGNVYAVTEETQKEIDNAEQEKTQIEKDLQALQNEKNTLTQNKNQTQLELETMQDQIAAINQELSVIQTKQDEKQSEIKQTKKEIEVCQNEIDTQYDSMKLRIKFMYENSQESLWSVLLKSGFGEFLNRLEYVLKIQTYDREKLAEYNSLLAELEGKKTSLEEAQSELEALESDKVTKQQELEETKASTNEKLNQYIASIDDTMEDLEDKSESLKEKEEIILALYTKAEKEEEAEKQRRAEEEARKLAAALEEAEKARQEAEKKKAEQEKEGNTEGEAEGENDGETESSDGEKTPTPGIVVENSGITNRNIELTEEEMTEFIAIIYCEARGESVEGQKAVAHVILNRMMSNKFPNTLDGVVRQAWQFEPVSTGLLDYVLTAKNEGLSGIINEKAWNTCEQSALAALSEESNVGESLFFRTWKPVPQLIENLEKAGVPYWVIGNHVIYYSWTVY